MRPIALSRTSAVVGLHPDEATEPIVSISCSLGKRYAVVPCCVFPEKFPQRQLRDIDVRGVLSSRERRACSIAGTFAEGEETQELVSEELIPIDSSVAVRSYEQFLFYLCCAGHGRLETLPFRGRNVVVYSM